MHIYFAGIGGMALGPLAELAKDAGHEVAGSDASDSAMVGQLRQHGITVTVGRTADGIAAAHAARPLDWVAASSAIKPDDPIIAFAAKHGIKLTKRDELLNKIICQDAKQKIIAVAGTHGKTTTTAMLVWLFKQFDIPASYSVGTLLSFGPSGHFTPDAGYFVYEADEYDRNMLRFKPAYSIIPSVDYDHPDTYPTVEDYQGAFRQLIAQSGRTYLWQKDAGYLDAAKRHLVIADDLLTQSDTLSLPGEHTRRNALLAAGLFDSLFPELGFEQIIAALNRFPGTWRRFEKLAGNLYTTYAHHPAEIAANLQMAGELSNKVVAVYQPHQNVRQHSLQNEYKDCFNRASHVFWLPTYLTREDPALPVLTPRELIAKLDKPELAEPAKMDDALLAAVKKELRRGALVVFMGAGDVDEWLRQNLDKITAS